MADPSGSSGSTTPLSATAGFERVRQLVQTLIEQRNDLHVRLRQSELQVETLTRDNRAYRMVSDDGDIDQNFSAQVNHQRALVASRQHDELKSELATARRLIEDLLEQNSSYRALVKKLKTSLEGWVHWFLRNGGNGPAHERPRSYEVQPAAPQRGPEWIRGNWLSDPDDPSSRSLLAKAEDLYRRNEDTEALNEVSTLLNRTDISDTERAQAQLLHAAILSASNNPGPALYHAEMGFILANKAGSIELVCNAQFHRGIAFLGLLKFAEASHCFSLAEGTPLHAEEITPWKARAETARLRFPEGHPKRLLEKSFIPRPTS